MHALDEIVHLAAQVQQLEKQAAAVTDSWYDFSPADQDDPGEVAALTQSAAHILEQLSQDLNALLHSTNEHSPTKSRLQYAYNTVQELLQSRIATEDMTSNMVRNPGSAYQEYLRAVALKEQAALSQVDKLLDTLLEIQTTDTQLH